MMFPLYILGTIVVSSMLVKTFFSAGLPSSSTSPPLLTFFLFLIISPAQLLSEYMQTTLCKRARAPQWKPFLTLKSYVPPLDCRFFFDSLYSSPYCIRLLMSSQFLYSFFSPGTSDGWLCHSQNKNPTLFIGIYAARYIMCCL